MSKFGFIMKILWADEKALRDALSSIYDQLMAVDEGISSEIHADFLYMVQRKLTEKDDFLERSGPRALIDQAFDDLSADSDPIERGLLLFRLNQILTGRQSSVRPSWCFHVIGPKQECYEKQSARGRALALQKQFRMPCKSAKSIEDIKHSRGILLEAPLGPEELMLAGAAIERGCRVSCIGEVESLHSIPSFQTAEEAFGDLIERAYGQLDGVSPFDPEMDPWDLPAPLSEEAEKAALQLRIEVLEQSFESLLSSATYSSDRNAAKTAELDLLMKEESTPEAVRNAYFQIIANGSRDGHSPTAAQKINGLRSQVDQLKEQLKEAQSLQDGGTPEP